MGIHTGDVLETIASLISQIKQFCAKLPEVVPLSVVRGGIKPGEDAVEAYERSVSRFRDLGGASAFKRLNELFVESLEAFETGRVLAAIQPLLMALDHLELLQREKAVTLTPAEEGRLKNFRAALHKILPGNEPELEGAGKGL